MKRKNLFKKLFKYVVDPNYRFIINSSRGIKSKLPDEKFVQKQHLAGFGRKLDLNNPITFNEKIQWLKLYNRKSEYAKMVDKYAAKEYVASIIGESHIIPSLGVWDNVDDIDFDKLPDQFVLKCTHNSGLGMFICKDKSTMDIKKVKKELKKGLKQNYYEFGREWAYKNVKPRIIAEQYMVDESKTELKDYKFFCFNGTPHYIQVDIGRFTNHRRNIYSTKWERLDFSIAYPTAPDVIIAKPVVLDEMLDIASKLSAGIPHVRVDLYLINDKIYFGELTFYHGSGLEHFSPEIWDKTFGDCITLPEKTESD